MNPVDPSIIAARAATASRKDADRQAAARERVENGTAGFGGPHLKLSVFGTIPGYHLYWENDEDAAIEQLLHEGFDFVSLSDLPSQASARVVTDQDIGDRISKFVGTKADGSPLRAYLMKCTDEQWEDRQAMQQRLPDQWEQAILASAQSDENRYKPNGTSISVQQKR